MRRETADKAGAGSNEQFTAEAASGTREAIGLTGIWLEFTGCHLWICKMCHRVVWKPSGLSYCSPGAGELIKEIDPSLNCQAEGQPR